jgi:hypothetical protein
MAWEIGFSPAKKGNVGMLRYLKERGYELRASLATKAAQAGHLAVMKYLSSEGNSWRNDNQIVSRAAESGNLEMVSLTHVGIAS